MMSLNWAERSIQVFTSSMARSKFFTYSPYIFRKGASFCRMSPMRGFKSLQTAKGEASEELPRRRRGRGRGEPSSPLLHPLLQRRQQKLLVEAVDGADVGEDSLDDVTGEGGARARLLQETGTEHLREEKSLVHTRITDTGTHLSIVSGRLTWSRRWSLVT